MIDRRIANDAYGPLEGISNYKIETTALMMASVQFNQMTSKSSDCFTSLDIFKNNQAAPDLLAKPLQTDSLQYLSWFLLRSYRKIQSHLQIRLYWTPGHKGIDMNEQADEAAKKAKEEGVSHKDILYYWYSHNRY